MRELTITGFVFWCTAMALLVLASRRYPDRIARFDETVRELRRWRAVRLVLVVAWAWLGWHFLAR